MAAESMERLADQYADRAVRSVFLYTREAHPGENYRHHRSMDDKRANARAFVEYSKVRRQVLLDDLEGTAHRAYGMLPNMTWIIGRGGMIHYKSAWTSGADVVDALEGVLDFQANRAKKQWVAFYSERTAWSTRDMNQFKAGLSEERAAGARRLRADDPGNPSLAHGAERRCRAAHSGQLLQDRGRVGRALMPYFRDCASMKLMRLTTSAGSMRPMGPEL